MKRFTFLKRFILSSAFFFFSFSSVFAGYLESARYVFSGDARSRYEEALKYIEQSNFVAAKESLEKFKMYLTKMNDYFLYIDNDKEVLNKETESVWNEFYTVSSSPWKTLCIRSGTLEGQLGKINHERDVEIMKDAYRKCGELLDKIYYAFKEYSKHAFGRQNSIEKMLRNLENGKLTYIGDAQSYYLDAIKYIEQSNLQSAKESLTRFKDQLIKINDYFLYIDNDKEIMSSDARSTWNDFFNGSSSPWRELNIYTTGLNKQLGVENYSNSLDVVKNKFRTCGDSINRIHDVLKNIDKGGSEKQKTMMKICDSCN